MDLIGNLSSIPKPHGLLQKDLHLIHPLNLAIIVILHILLMSHLTPTISWSNIRMVKYLLGLLVLTAGMVPQWRKSGCPKVFFKIFKWMSSWHHWRKEITPGQILHLDQSRQMDAYQLMLILTLLCREIDIDMMNMCLSLKSLCAQNC